MAIRVAALAAVLLPAVSAFSPLRMSPGRVTPLPRSRRGASGGALWMVGNNEPIRITDEEDWVDQEPAFEDGRNLFLNKANPEQRICYDAFYGTEELSIVVLPYLNTPKNQGFAANIEGWCRRNGFTYICADYHGVSKSGGDLSKGTVTRWTEDTIQLLEKAVPGKAVLVGAAVGGWVMMRVAMRRPDLVAALVGVSCDPDFTEELLWNGLNEDDKAAIMENGEHEITWGDTKYLVSRALVEDGRKNLVLSGGPNSVDIDAPVRLVHGMMDEEVPISMALRLVEALRTDDVKLSFLKRGTHFVDQEGEYNELRRAIEDAVDAAKTYVYDLTSPGSG